MNQSNPAHVTSIIIEKEGDVVFAFMSDPQKLDRWSFGTWQTEIAPDGLVTGTSIFDGTKILVRIDAEMDLGVDRILTSGQEASVLEGLPLITELVKRAGDRVIIMPGGGITARNVERIVAAARPREIHFASLQLEAGDMRFRRAHVFMGGELRPPEYDRLATSEAVIRSVMKNTK